MAVTLSAGIRWVLRCQLGKREAREWLPIRHEDNDDDVDDDADDDCHEYDGNLDSELWQHLLLYQSRFLSATQKQIWKKRKFWLICYIPKDHVGYFVAITPNEFGWQNVFFSIFLAPNHNPTCLSTKCYTAGGCDWHMIDIKSRLSFGLVLNLGGKDIIISGATFYLVSSPKLL